MRVTFAILLATVLHVQPSDVLAQFLRRPAHTDFVALDSPAPSTDAKVLAQGEFKLYGGEPRVGVTVMELYLSPDNNWKYTIPILLLSSAPAVPDTLSTDALASDLLDLAGGFASVQIGYDKDFFRSTRDNLKSITGVYLNMGAATKAGFAPSAAGGTAQVYVTANPYVRIDLRHTFKRDPTANDYQGVVNLRIRVSGSFFLQNSSNLAALFGVQDVGSYGTIEVKLGIFPFDGASLDLFSWTTSWGNDIDALKKQVAVGVSLFPRQFVK